MTGVHQVLAGGKALAPSEFSYLGTAGSNTNASSYSFSGVSLGTAAANRKILIAVSAPSGGGGGVPTAVEVDNGPVIPLTKLIEIDGSQCTTSFWIGVVAADTSASVDVTFSGSESSCGITVWRVVNYQSTLYDSFTVAELDPAEGTLDCPASGVVVACTTCNGLGTTTWAGVTEHHENATDTIGFSAGSEVYVSEQIGLTVSADRSISANHALAAIALARGV